MDTSTAHHQIQRAADCLRRGGLVAFPTDTLYALGADAFNVEAVRRVFVAKKRSPDMGLPLLLHDRDMLDQVAEGVPQLARVLAERFWPGPLTLVLPRSAQVPYEVTGGLDSVAVRVPDHPLALRLIAELGRPVTGTSANASGGPDPTTAAQVKADLGTACDMVLPGGPATLGISSTIVDMTESQPRLVRLGAVPWEAIESALAARST